MRVECRQAQRKIVYYQKVLPHESEELMIHTQNQIWFAIKGFPNDWDSPLSNSLTH
jgi:hypothetical protein